MAIEALSDFANQVVLPGPRAQLIYLNPYTLPVPGWLYFYVCRKPSA
jgi:hypothetical protein